MSADKFIATIILIIFVAIFIYMIPMEHQPSDDNHSIFKELNDTEKQYVLYVMSATARGEIINMVEHPSPSIRASESAIQELENAGIV